MSNISQFNRDKLAASQSELTERNMETYKAWLETKPHLLPCEANLGMFLVYLDDFQERELVFADLDFALSNIGEGSLATQKVFSQQEIADIENKRRRALRMPALIDLCRAENPRYSRPPLPAEWTADTLRALAKNDLRAFKKLAELHSYAALNDRLKATPTPQVGRSVKLEI